MNRMGVLALGGILAAGAGAFLLSGELNEATLSNVGGEVVVAKPPVQRPAFVNVPCRDVIDPGEKRDVDGGCLVMTEETDPIADEIAEIPLGTGRRLMACKVGKDWVNRWGPSGLPMPVDCAIVHEDLRLPDLEINGVDTGKRLALCNRFCPSVPIDDCPIQPGLWGKVWRCATTSGSWDVSTCRDFCEGR